MKRTVFNFLSFGKKKERRKRFTEVSKSSIWKIGPAKTKREKNPLLISGSRNLPSDWFWNWNISIEGLCTLLYDANSFLPYCVCVCVCSLTQKVGTAGIMKTWTFKIYLFWDKLHAIPVHSNMSSIYYKLVWIVLYTYQLSWFGSILAWWY